MSVELTTEVLAPEEFTSQVLLQGEPTLTPQRQTRRLAEEPQIAALMAALRREEEEQMENLAMQEIEMAETGPVLESQQMLAELTSKTPMEDILMEDAPMEDVPMEDLPEQGPLTEDQPAEDPESLLWPTEEELMEEMFPTPRPRYRRPPHWQHATATQSKLQRSLHMYKLKGQLEEYLLNRSEITTYGPPENQSQIRGPTLSRSINSMPAPPMDAISRAEKETDDKEGLVDSAEVNALYVPENRLQMDKYNESIRMRDFYLVSSEQEMVSITMPTAYETWKMEKEYSEMKPALDVFVKIHKEDENERKHRAGLWSDTRDRVTLLRSRGYGSSFREVISVDEEWPEEDWASAGLQLQPDAPFLERFEAKMRTRPVLVPSKSTETR